MSWFISNFFDHLLLKSFGPFFERFLMNDAAADVFFNRAELFKINIQINIQKKDIFYWIIYIFELLHFIHLNVFNTKKCYQ